MLQKSSLSFIVLPVAHTPAPQSLPRGTALDRLPSSAASVVVRVEEGFADGFADSGGDRLG